MNIWDDVEKKYYYNFIRILAIILQFYYYYYKWSRNIPGIPRITYTTKCGLKRVCDVISLRLYDRKGCFPRKQISQEHLFNRGSRQWQLLLKKIRF